MTTFRCVLVALLTGFLPLLPLAAQTRHPVGVVATDPASHHRWIPHHVAPARIDRISVVPPLIGGLVGAALGLAVGRYAEGQCEGGQSGQCQNGGHGNLVAATGIGAVLGALIGVFYAY